MATIKKESFGKLKDGREVELYTLRNTKGTQAQIITYGARLVAWKFRNQDFKLVDVVLGYEDIATYEQDDKYLGAIVGRHANRIAEGKAVVGGKEYQLELNDGSRKQNHLHGGFHGFDKQLWEAEETHEGLKLTYRSKDGEGGYPGNLTATVTYGLSNDNELSIRYEAVSDKDTVCNLTNHSYFNLDGFDADSVLEQKLQIFSDEFTENDEESLPTGKILPVEGTPMDFREPTAIGARIGEDYDQLVKGKGYDHNWILRDKPAEVEMEPGMFGYDPGCPIDYLEAGLKNAAYAYSEKSGISLTAYTDLPGIQFYSGNYLDKNLPGKQGVRFGLRSGFCLETQYYPNAFQHPEFPQPILKAGEVWKSQTVYVLKLRR